MRRFAFVLVASLAMLALVAPVVQARHGSHKPPATFVAHTSTGTQGGALHVMAKVKHAQHGSTFSATATVHFTSGDQTVTLKRHGKSFVAKGTVAVASDETPGSVPVTVTVTYDGSDSDVQTQGDVEQGDDQGDTTDPSCDPTTTTCDDQSGDDQGEDAGQSCDPTTTTCDDQSGDDNNQGDDQGDSSGSDGPGD
jgi:hypothetical protein